MTHVFVAPHPDDVALSCGGLIASLRELGQNVTIITVFSGNGGDRRAVALPARGARVRVEGDVAGRPRRSTAAPILPDYPIDCPRWAADDEALEATQADADAAAKRFWQRSSWYRRASIRNESLAGQPVIDDLSTQGAVLTDEVVDAAAAGDLMARRRLEDERYAYFAEAIDRVPRPARRGLPRLRGRRAAARRAARRRHRARPSSCGARSPGSSRSRSTCRSASAATSTTSCAARSASRCSPSATAGSCPGPEYAGTVVFYEDFPYAWWNDFRTLDQLGPDALSGPAGGREPVPDLRRHRRPDRAQDHRHHASTRARSSACSTAPARWPTPCASYGAALGELGDVDGPAERYWVTSRV